MNRKYYFKESNKKHNGVDRSELLNEGSGAASHHVCYISFLEAANGRVFYEKKGILKNFTKFT